MDGGCGDHLLLDGLFVEDLLLESDVLGRQGHCQAVLVVQLAHRGLQLAPQLLVLVDEGAHLLLPGRGDLLLLLGPDCGFVEFLVEEVPLLHQVLDVALVLDADLLVVLHSLLQVVGLLQERNFGEFELLEVAAVPEVVVLGQSNHVLELGDLLGGLLGVLPQHVVLVPQGVQADGGLLVQHLVLVLGVGDLALHLAPPADQRVVLVHHRVVALPEGRELILQVALLVAAQHQLLLQVGDLPAQGVRDALELRDLLVEPLDVLPVAVELALAILLLPQQGLIILLLHPLEFAQLAIHFADLGVLLLDDELQLLLGFVGLVDGHVELQLE